MRLTRAFKGREVAVTLADDTVIRGILTGNDGFFVEIADFSVLFGEEFVPQPGPSCLLGVAQVRCIARTGD
jgi:hypothetical protein